MIKELLDLSHVTSWNGVEGTAKLLFRGMRCAVMECLARLREVADADTLIDECENVVWSWGMLGENVMDCADRREIVKRKWEWICNHEI